MMGTKTTPPRIWIGCLNAYNCGRLHGEWFDAAVDEDEIYAAKDKVIRTSPGDSPEEWFIADYEGFSPYRVEEYASLSKVAMVARLIEEKGVGFAVWLSNDDSVLDGADEHDLAAAYDEATRGVWDKEEDFARELVSELGLPTLGYVYPERASYGGFHAHEERPNWGEVLDQLDIYLDWDAITQAMLEDYIVIEHGEPGERAVYVFYND